MIMRERTLNRLMAWEGFSALPYRDQGGILTIGYGRTDNVSMADRTTPEIEQAWLRSYIANLEAKIVKLSEHPLRQHQLEALTMLVFNIGVGAYTDSTLRRAIRDANWPQCDYEWLRWVYVDDQVSPGLIVRRSRELRLWRWGYLK